MSTHDAPAAITLRVNGKPLQLPAESTLRALIEQMGMGKHAVAAEVGGVLVPHREHAQRVLREGEIVELVSLVGGG
jgi:sulfur carrier protein